MLLQQKISSTDSAIYLNNIFEILIFLLTEVHNLFYRTIKSFVLELVLLLSLFLKYIPCYFFNRSTKFSFKVHNLLYLKK